MTETGGTNAFASDTPAAPIPKPPVDVISLVEGLVKSLENNASPQVLASYVGEVVALVGFLVGAFDSPLGLSISTVPQAVILGVSGMLALGMGIFRLITHNRTKAAVASVVAPVVGGNLAPANPGAVVNTLP